MKQLIKGEKITLLGRTEKNLGKDSKPSNIKDAELYQIMRENGSLISVN